jgi:hypothetical protein
MAVLAQRTGATAPALVWFTLFTLADGRTGRLPAKYSARSLAKLTGLARSTVLRALDHLVENHLIEVTLTHRGMTCSVNHHQKGSP